VLEQFSDEEGDQGVEQNVRSSLAEPEQSMKEFTFEPVEHIIFMNSVRVHLEPFGVDVLACRMTEVLQLFQVHHSVLLDHFVLD